MSENTEQYYVVFRLCLELGFRKRILYIIALKHVIGDGFFFLHGLHMNIYSTTESTSSKRNGKNKETKNKQTPYVP